MKLTHELIENWQVLERKRIYRQKSGHRRSHRSSLSTDRIKMDITYRGNYYLLALCGLFLITTTAAVLEPSQPQSRIVRRGPISDHDEAAIVERDSAPCKTYVTQGGDTCKSITKAHGITMEQLQIYNSYTWRFDCQNMPQGSIICIGPGSPPMPTAVSNATCGPLVPGTARPAKWSDLASLNPCASKNECVSLTRIIHLGNT
jgi:hypothetical protein